MFWFVGLIPDLATLRRSRCEDAHEDHLRHAVDGWRGSARHWYQLQSAYLLLAGLATPLVLSVHS